MERCRELAIAAGLDPDARVPKPGSDRGMPVAVRSREVHAGTWSKVAAGCYEVRGKILGMVHRMPKLVLVAALPLLGLGCSAVEGEENAGRGMRAMMRMLGVGAPGAALVAAEDGRPTDFRAFGVDIDGGIRIDANVPCPDGGKMKLEGQASLESELGTVEGWETYIHGAEPVKPPPSGQAQAVRLTEKRS